MKYLYRTLKPFSLNGNAAVLRVKTDGQQLYVTVTPAVSGSRLPEEPISLTAVYGDTTRSLSSDPFRETTASFPYDDGEKRLILSGAEITCNGRAKTEFAWSGSFADPDPTVGAHMNGVRSGDTPWVFWNAEPPENGTVYPVLAEYCADSGLEGFPVYHPTFDGPQTDGRNPLPVTQLALVPAGRKVWVRLCFALYDEDSASAPGENYIGLAEVSTEVHILTSAQGRFVPRELICRRPVQGAPLKLCWSEVIDAGVAGYELQRSVNGGSYAMIYRGSSLSFTDQTGRDWDTVSYRVKTLGINTTFRDSVWNEGVMWIPLRTNLYVSRNGRLLPAAGLFAGRNGTITEMLPVLSVGRNS